MQRFIWFIGFLITYLPISLQAQTIHYVSPDGLGNGSSWAQSSSLADAVANASSNDQFWLKEGVYEINQTVEFSYSHSGIRVYGGFDGTESSLDQRNAESNETIWDGLGERRILWIGADDITVDGLTLRGGFVDGDNDGGGGVYISASRTTIRHCTFRDNVGAGGRGSGAIYNRNGTGLLIDHCLFENNRTQTFAGDANGGGAIFSWASDMVVSHSAFRNNVSHNDGGAIYSWDSMELSDCVFEDNYSEKTGGAIRVHSSSSAIIRNVVFSNNHADGNGGAICVGLSAEATVINSLFDTNTAGDKAGAIYNSAGLRISNATFVNNQHHAIVFRSFSGDDYFTYIYNSIFYENTSPAGTSPDISPSVYGYTSVDVELRRNVLQTDPLGSYTVAGNQIGVNPQFADPANNDYRLQSASPAIDAGRAMLFNGVSPMNAGASTDLEGNPRRQGANIDMGAYEAEPPVIPECTIITIPADGATDVALDADITWAVVEGATGYRVYIGTAPGSTDITEGQEVSGTAFGLPDGFAENTTYHVTVVPYNAAGEATDCTEISFTTETLLAPPGCATITSPADGATDVALDADITWAVVEGATGYRVYIGTTVGGTDVVDGEEVSGTTFSVPDGFAENTTYHVTVVPYNSAGEATDCTEISFTTETLLAPPGCATITGPADGATDVALDADITWAVVEGATGYRVYIGTAPGSTDITEGQEVSGTAFGLPDGFAENTTYYVTVVPYNSAGEATDCTEISFTTETLLTPPGCATITIPADGATDVALDADITWAVVEGATGYRVYIGTAVGGTDVIDGEEESGTTFSVPDGFAENTTYYVTVVPYNSAGEATDCTEISFTTETLLAPPGCATITAPADGATDVALDADITWAVVEEATGYRVYIGTAPGSTDITEGQEVSGTAFGLPDGFAENTTYYVTVVPYNSAGEATDCTEISFTTETLLTPPGCATITIPADGATDVALDADITWAVVEGATGYRVYIGTAVGGTDVIDGEEESGTTFSVPDGFAENTTYYVTVVPYNSAGETTDCTEISFTTETLLALPGCATITSPADGATDVALDADITWAVVEGATGYRVYIGTTVGGTDVVDGEEVSGTTFSVPDGFAENTTHYVTVVPYNSAGEATDCTEVSFTTETLLAPPGCATITIPAAGATDVALDADITWAVVEGATGYRVYIGTTVGGTDVVDGEEVSGTTFSVPDGFAENTTHYVTVVPYNSAGEATDCTEISFTTETLLSPPGCATITVPADGATDVALDADITWAVVEEATGYRVYIGTAPGSTDITEGQEVSGTAFGLPDGFAENTTYYVTVVPYNSAGEATDCTEISFTTETLLAPPGCATITIPADGATDVALDADITWAVVEGATGYRVYIGTAVGGTDVIDGEEESGTTFSVPDGFAENTTYYVTVVPYNSAGETTDCTEISFTTETLLALPGCATITSPADGANSTTLDEGIIWTAVEGADGYHISIGTTPGGTDVLDNETVTRTWFEPGVDFAENTAYYITVIPFNAAGEAAGCGYTRFVIVSSEHINRTKYGISPNGDGINDFWKIEGIEKYPNNTVSIYNRWGDMVFHITNYDNVSKIFNGEANRLTRLGGGTLPSGTYFFVLQYRDQQEQKKVEGFLVLKR